MNFIGAKEEEKKYLQDYLLKKGIDINKTFSCLNPNHEDVHPSMSYDSNRCCVHCFSCGADYDIFNLVEIDTGLEGSELFNRVYEMAGINTFGEKKFSEEKKMEISMKTNSPRKDVFPENMENFFIKCHENLIKTDYWKERGITKEICDKYNLGYWVEQQRFIIPTGEKSCNARYIGGNEKIPRYLKPKGEYSLFNIEALEENEEPIFIVEGEFDALSIIEAGAQAVSMGSSGSSKLIRQLEEKKPKFPLILCLDNDKAGREGQKRLASEMTQLNIDFLEADVCGSSKDCNEALIKNRLSFIEAVQKAKNLAAENLQKKKRKEIEEYNRSSAAYGIENFIDEIKKRYNRDCLSTGFSEIDELLDGGFYPGLYVLGAVSSLGKTTFALQIADNVAKSGNDVLVFSLEMAGRELIAKSLSRLSFEKTISRNTDASWAVTTRNLLNGKALQTKEQADFMNEVLKMYNNYSMHIYNEIGMGDIGVDQIKKRIEKHIRITGNKPLVIIDYLQILAPYDVRATDKQNMDKAVVELKKASRDFDIPILVISSFNRENYTSPVNLQSFKESGAIEYTSDVLMALQYKGMDFQRNENGKYEDEKSRVARIIQLKNEQEKIAEVPGKFQDIQVKVLKNRNGRKGSADMNFCPMFNYFRATEKTKTEWIKK